MSVLTICVIVGFFILMFILFLIGLPISFSMALIGLLGFAYFTDFEAALHIAKTSIFDVFSNYSLSVVPLFILMGLVASNAGIVTRLYDTSSRIVGHIPGGLALATILGGVLFKAICGSTPAMIAILSTVAGPEMDRHNYDKALSCGTVAVVGTLGLFMPPSVALIIYAIISDQSIMKLFLAGVLPGLLISFFYFITILGWCRINPVIGPKGEKFSWKERIEAIPPILPVAIIFIIVIGGLIIGYFTPVEAGSIGVVAVLLLSLIKRDINFKGFIKAISESLSIACMVIFILAGASVLSHFFAITRIPFFVSEWLGTLPLPREVIIIFVLLTYLIFGSFIEDMALLIMITPIFLPLIGKLGYDLVWFGIVIMVTTGIGMIIPPVAANVFVVSSIRNVPLNTVYKGVYPYLVGMTICLFIFLFFPQIVLWLPSLLTK